MNDRKIIFDVVDPDPDRPFTSQVFKSILKVLNSLSTISKGKCGF